jgi:pullulanase/glycogen debranching enzyme
MTYEEHFESLISDLNNRFPKLVKKYDLSISHSGGGCFHIDCVLDENLSVLINPYNEDVEYNVPKNENTQCIFCIYEEDGEERKTFIKPFAEGLKELKTKKKGKKQ